MRNDLDKVISFYNSEPKSTYEPQTQLIKTLQEYKCKRNEWPIAELPSGEEVIERYLKANKVSAENIQEVKKKNTSLAAYLSSNFSAKVSLSMNHILNNLKNKNL